MVSTPPRPIPDNLPGMAVAGLSQEFRHYGDPGDPVQGWQVSEEDYVAEQARRHVRRAETNALGWKRTVEDTTRKMPRKERERAEWNLRYWTEETARVKTEGPNSANLENWRSEYLAGVKKAISTGKPVPYAVIKQRKEFRTAQDARARYEKGVHTSFGNESIAVNRGMKKARGYKVKRQDGKPINAAQLKEIETGFDEIESVLGPVKDILDWCDITIAHTNGKHPFLKNAGGLYRSGDRTISMGVADHSGGSIASLAHELAHFLDFEAGRVLGKETKFWGHSYSRRTPILSTSLAEAETRYGSDNVLNRARYNINNVREVERTMKLQQVLQPTEKDKIYVERTKVALGPYWREPCEIFARLVEQYIRAQIGHGGASIEENYGSKPGWWTDEEFAKLAPQIRIEIDRRLKILRDAIASGMTPPKVLSKSFIGGIRLVLGNLFAKSEQLALFGHPVHYHTGEPRKPVQAPGSRGARYWIDDHGTVRYDERPKALALVQADLALKPPAAVATTAAAIAISKPPDPKRAEKLRALADGMQGTIDQKRDPGVSHQNVTRRRSEMAAGMAMDADRLEGIQSVLYALGDLHENGTVPQVLEHITSRVQVEELLASRWHNGKVVIGPETYPRPMLRAHDVTDMLRLARHLRIPGAREITYRTNDEYVEVDTPAQWEAIGAVARKVLQAKRDGKVKDKVSLPDSPGGWEWAHSLIWGAQRVSEASAAIKRVAALNLTPEQWGRAQAEIRKLRKEIVRGRDVQVREMERKLIGVKIPGYFPTPKVTVEHLLDLADIRAGMRVLEPSAGKGNIADVIATVHPDAQLDVLEYDYNLRQILSFKGHNVIGFDFTEYDGGPYDRVVMNPPFEDGQDVRHVMRAYELLKPGGRLVSIMGAHTFFAGDRRSQDFREWLDAHGGTEQKLPEKSFMSSERPTGVNTHLVVIDKPAEVSREYKTLMAQSGVHEDVPLSRWEAHRQQPPPRPTGAAPLIPVPDIARQIASMVDISKPQAEPDIAGVGGVAWLRENAARKVAEEVARIDRMNADTATPEERVERVGKRYWAYRTLGHVDGDSTHPGLHDTRKEAIAAATRNAEVSTEMAPIRLAELIEIYKQDAGEPLAKAVRRVVLFLKAQQLALFGDGSIKQNPSNFLGTDKVGRTHWRAPAPTVAPDLAIVVAPRIPIVTRIYKELGTRAPAFKAWFGDFEADPEHASKVVDAAGEPQETYKMPKVLYHGTSQGGFTAFNAAQVGSDLLFGPGFYFTEDRSVAEEYTNKNDNLARISDWNVKELAKFIRKHLPPGVSLKRSSFTMHGLGVLPSHIESSYHLTENASGRVTDTLPLISTSPTGAASFINHVPDILKWDASLRSQWEMMVHSVGWKPTDRRPEVKACYLNIRRPFDGDTDKAALADMPLEYRQRLATQAIRNPDFNPKDSASGPSHRYGLLDHYDYGDLTRALYVGGGRPAKGAANECLAAMGYDGITHMGGMMSGDARQHRVWIAFKPEQIKAADNVGTFNPHDADMFKAYVTHDRRQLLKEREQINKDLFYLDNEDWPAAAPELQPALDSKRKALKHRMYEIGAQIDKMEAYHA